MFLLNKNKQFLYIISSFLLIIFTFFFIILELIDKSIKYKDDKIVYANYEIFKNEITKKTNHFIKTKEKNFKNLYFNNKNCYKYRLRSIEDIKILNRHFKNSNVNPFTENNEVFILCTKFDNLLKFFEERLNSLKVIYFKSKISDIYKIRNFSEISFEYGNVEQLYLIQNFLYNFEYKKYQIIQRKYTQLTMYFKNINFNSNNNLDKNFVSSINYCYLDNYDICILLDEYKELLIFKNYLEQYTFEKFINNSNYLDDFRFKYLNNEYTMYETLLNISSLLNLKAINDYRQKEFFHASFDYLFFEINKNNYLSITYIIYLLILTFVIFLILQLIYKLKT